MRQSKILIFISVMLLGLLVACSGGEQAQTAETEKVNTKIGFLPITDHLILGISEKHDNANFEHLTLDPVKFSDWATISESLASGSLDGAFLLAPLAYQTHLRGTPSKLVLLGHRDGSAIIVKTGEGITNAAGLEGKLIAIPHVFSTHHMLLHKYVKEAAAEIGFETIEMAPPDMPAALSTGTIDGYIVAEPFGARGELMGTGEILVLSNSIWEGHPDCVLVMRDEYLQNHPAAADELIKSMIEAGIYASENRVEAAKIGSEFLGQPEDAMLKAMLEPEERVTFLHLQPEISEFAELQDYMAEEMGLFPQKADLEAFIDASYAEKAYQAISTS